MRRRAVCRLHWLRDSEFLPRSLPLFLRGYVQKGQQRKEAIGDSDEHKHPFRRRPRAREEEDADDAGNERDGGRRIALRRRINEGCRDEHCIDDS